MRLKLALSLLLYLTIIGMGWSQVTIQGTVVTKSDKSPLPGVSVLIKGTQSGTVVSKDGSFSLVVTDPNAILVFSFIGFDDVEYPLNGETKVMVRMKERCIRDYFDVQGIAVYAIAGLLNTPIGGQFDLAFPPYFGKGTLVAGVSYQTNFGRNEFLNGKIELRHFVWTCNFEMDVNWYYRSIRYNGDFRTSAYSFETNLGFNNLTVTTGYSNLRFDGYETSVRQVSSGPIIGFGIWIGAARLSVSGKAAIYRNRQEYLGSISRDFRHLNTFLRFYNVDSFNEVSLGIGTDFGYRFKSQNR